MTTLTTAPVAPLLTRLFAQADALRPENLPIFAQTSPEEIDRLMQSKAEWRELYTHLKDIALPVSREAGRLLYMLARSMNARHIVEFGTSFGLSTLHLAAALRDNGASDARIITAEFEPSKIARAADHLAQAGLADLVEIRAGDALETLAHGLPDGIDLVLLDGAKALYPDVLALVEPHLRPGALILADNADYCPHYLAKVRAPGQGYLSLPFAEDIELSMWIGAKR
ncbi:MULTISPECIES: O-methyltransferase [unclassified Novosphingobium]|uniref:O-methyltransferase n=1 Tax=unclassified Novosphingobium TaxID=2644732 RepID=UPI00086C060C|nr:MULTISPECIES: class I SAM-dependent methyltransferase [unclassified Novosphingobium]MBN9144282.1 class I SAM-dependent methyltransferase [Novosphingobium sp.]MDR6708385.1 putative O-methyltransferase YrrM [Novosphingobium sp. 1748]ODU77470.1 MAG: methyltransferase [Novosphingobium sp. SCN 63-17]OJX94919.1 MAG: methyltransferase [Novosphingobium sp. 63-713]